LKNFTRHASQGFNLCDGVHCQAFNGKSRMNRLIYTSSESTRGVILTDTTGNPLFTAFHASCGGITCSAAMAWNRDLPYLLPVKDPFCDQSEQRNWSKDLDPKTWNEYLGKKGIRDATAPSGPFTGERRKYLEYGTVKLPLTAIREDFGLKSAFFTLERIDGRISIKGHGYGHGVGLCQEGAIEMSRLGYTYLDILMFYFHGPFVMLSTAKFL